MMNVIYFAELGLKLLKYVMKVLIRRIDRGV